MIMSCMTVKLLKTLVRLLKSGDLFGCVIEMVRMYHDYTQLHFTVEIVVIYLFVFPTRYKKIIEIY